MSSCLIQAIPTFWYRLTDRSLRVSKAGLYQIGLVVRTTRPDTTAPRSGRFSSEEG